MPLVDDFLAEAGVSQPAAAATPYPSADVMSSPLVRSLVNPVGHTLDESLKAGSSWDQTAQRLRDLGADPTNYEDKKQHFELAARKKELSDRGLSFSQSWRGQYQPFGSLVTVPESVVRPLDYVSREIGRLGGKEQDVGGRVVGNQEYQTAVNAFKAGKATSDDIDKIATYERHAQIRGEIKKGANYAESFALSLGGLGSLYAETATGLGAIGGVTKGVNAVRGTQAAAAATGTVAGVAPAVPAAAELSLGARAGNLAVGTAVTPSMYVPLMQQANMRAGRTDANDFRGLPTAFGYAYANMMVLGRLGTPVSAESNAALGYLRKGIFGVAEIQSVDAGAGVADQFLPKAYQIKSDDERFGSVGEWLRAYRAGDKEKASEVLKDVTTQALSFGAFAAMHGREVKGTDLLQSYADTIGSLRAKGMDKSRAAEMVGELHVRLEDALSKDPYLSREKAREALDVDLHPELKGYADKLVETFEPQEKLPTGQEQLKMLPPHEDVSAAPKRLGEAEKVTAAATEPPDAQSTGRRLPSVRDWAVVPGDTVQSPDRKVGDVSTVTHVDPTDPNPDRQVTVEHSDGSVTNQPVDSVAARPVGTVEPPKPIAPTVLGTGTATPPAERAKQLDAQIADNQARLDQAAAAAIQAKLKPGGNPTVLRGLKRNVEKLKAEGERLKAERAEIRQPEESAVTRSEAPQPSPVEPKSEPSVTPPEPQKPAAVATGAPAAAIQAAQPPAVTPIPQVRPAAAVAARPPSRAELLNRLAGAGKRNVRADSKAKFSQLVERSPLDARNKSEQVQRFNALVDKLPDAAVRAIHENLTGVEPFRSLVDVSTAITQKELEGAKRVGDSAYISELLDRQKLIDTGLFVIPGAVSHTGVLYIDGHGQGPKGDTGKYAVPEVVRAEQILAHESGHLVDGNARRVHSGTPEWAAIHEAEMNKDNGQVSALSDYARTDPKESFAEFFRLVHESEVGHATIEREFPEASKFVQERNLWPEKTRPEKLDGMPEIFNEKVENKDGSHGDAVRGELKQRDLKPAASVGEGTDHTSELTVAGREDSGNIIVAPHEEVAGAGRIINIGVRPAERRQGLGTLLYLKALSKFDSLIGPKLSDVATKTLHSLEDQGLATVNWENSNRTGHYVAKITDAGREFLRSGESRPAAAAAPKVGGVVPKLEVKSEPKKEATKADWQEQYDSMDADEKANVRKDPELRKLYEDNGVNLDSKARLNRRGVQQRAVEGVEGWKQDVSDASDTLSKTEKEALTGLLDGKSTRDIGKSLGGISHTTVQKAAQRALDKMKSNVDGWEEFSSVSDLIARGVEEANRSKAAAGNEYQNRLKDKERAFDPAARDEDEFGISPFRIKWLSDIFARSGAGGSRTLWQRLSSAFFGDLPSAARAAKEQEIDGQISAYAFDVKNATNDLMAALKAEHVPYEALPKAQLKQLDAVLRGDKAARQGIGEKTLQALDVMRKQVDRLSQKLLDVGAIDSPLIAAVTDNIGSYLTRQYQVFRDPTWESKVDPAVVNRFKSWLSNELIGKGQPADADRVDAITKSLLRDGTAAENPIAFLRSSKLGAKDLSILKARKEIPEELRALWGEYEDPLVNYSNSVAKMSQLLTSHQFLTRVAGEGLNKFFFKDPTKTADGEYVVKISDTDTPTLQPLSGLHTTPEIKAAFENVFASNRTSWGMQWYMKALAAAKFNKTILSHVGQIHNFLSNVLVAVRSGHFDVTKAPAAAAAIAKDTPQAREYWRKLTTLGVVGEGLHFNDFQKTMADAFGGREVFQGQSGNIVSNNVLGRLLKGATSKAAALYNYGDAIWKVYGFENEKRQYMESGLSESEAERRAAQIVRDTMPTYSKIAPGLQALRKAPVVAPFIAFQAEMVRTSYNTLKLAISELKDPKTAGIGAKRLAGMAAAAALPMALTAATRAMFGVSDDEEKALRRFLPEYQKNSRLVYFGRDPKTGHPKYTDLSKIDPHAYITDGMIAFMRGKSSTEGLKNAADEWSKPFTQEELLTRPALDIARNQKEPGGHVYNPEDSSVNQAGDIATHVAGAFTPAAYGPARRMVKALAGSPEQKSGKTYDPTDTAVEQAGVRIETPRVREDLTNKALGFEAAKKESEKMVLEMVHAKGNVSPQELEAARQRTEAARRHLMDEFADDIAAAERLNVPRQEIAMILRNAGVSVQEVGLLFSGKRLPYFPELKGTATERVRAGEVRKSAASSLRP